ncbi:hypothetical protein KBTX_03708 [wastewater metagenome]|uniref:DNA primase n=2 Tax=unclassified sequences TaxID=12908 RepID=A0A5B8RHH4_9ZZZZ|nr:hypothetical protein [Arhodomonas sp. KWT]QEA07358.1 hypothetical protein KBTEX_03708 [uncultured organism]
MSTIEAPIDRLLARLDAVRGRGEGRWIARCPAHHDHTPSLGIAEGADGVVLVRCHAGCPTPDVLAATGLDMADLFPRRLRRGGRGPRRADARRLPRPDAAAMLAAVGGEAMICALAASDLAAGRALGGDDYARVMAAAATLRRAADAAGRHQA